MRIRKDERKAWCPTIEVYFQENAWVDKAAVTEWAEKTLQKFVNKEELSHFVLYADNLTGQESDKFKQVTLKLKGCVWFGLPDATDIWKPVDSGIAQTLKQLIAKTYRY